MMKTMQRLSSEINILEKQIRAEVIKKYVGDGPCVCFTSGNAGEALIKKGVNVLNIVKPGKWYNLEDVKRLKRFDATSGHLSMLLMQRIAKVMADKMREVYGEWPIFLDCFAGDRVMGLPTGSGETFVVLKMIFPGVNLTPIYNENDATKYEEKAPLNELVRALMYHG